MRLHIRDATRLLQHITETPTNRMRKRHVRNNSFAEESRLSHASACAIEKLIGNHHIERRILLLQRANGRRRKNTLDAQQLHRIDVRAEWNFSRSQTVTTSVTRQKGNAFAFESADDECVGRWSKRSLNFNFFDRRQLGHLVETAAADNPETNACCTHESSQPSPRYGTGLNSFSPCRNRQSGSSGSW